MVSVSPVYMCEPGQTYLGFCKVFGSLSNSLYSELFAERIEGQQTQLLVVCYVASIAVVF